MSTQTFAVGQPTVPATQQVAVQQQTGSLPTTTATGATDAQGINYSTTNPNLQPTATPVIQQQLHAAPAQTPDPLSELAKKLKPIALQHDAVAQTNPEAALLSEVKKAVEIHIGTQIQAKDSAQTDTLRQQLKDALNEAKNVNDLFSTKVIDLLAQARGDRYSDSAGAGYNRPLAVYAETVAKALIEMGGDINSQTSSVVMKLFTGKHSVDQSLATIALNGVADMLAHPRIEVAQETFTALRAVSGAEKWYTAATNLFGIGAKAGLRDTAAKMIEVVKTERPELELSSAISALGTDSFNLSEAIKTVSENIARGAKMNDLSLVQRAFQTHVWIHGNDAARAQGRELVNQTTTLLNGVTQANLGNQALASEVKYTLAAVTKFGDSL